MKLKEIGKDIYDVSALLDEELGKAGSPERKMNTDRAWEEYNAQIYLMRVRMRALHRLSLPNVSVQKKDIYQE